jgi:hypothetical protein
LEQIEFESGVINRIYIRTSFGVGIFTKTILKTHFSRRSAAAQLGLHDHNRGIESKPF